VHCGDSPCHVALLSVSFAVPLLAQVEDAEGCKDHTLFTRMPGFHISECKQSQFEQKHFPVGPVISDGVEVKSTPVEGAFFYLVYELNEGKVKPSPLQTMRNFQAASRKAGAAVMAEYPDWCKAAVHESLHNGNNCRPLWVDVQIRRPGKEGDLGFRSVRRRRGKLSDLADGA